MKAAVRPGEEAGRPGAITLKDKLSRLDFVRAGRLLGTGGEALIRREGVRASIFNFHPSKEQDEN